MIFRLDCQVARIEVDRDPEASTKAVDIARITDQFHDAYYRDGGNTWSRNTWMGYPIQQCPMDLLLYQQLVHRLRPGFILQTGVANGGSVLFFAQMLDLIGSDPSVSVVGIDLKLTETARTLSHPRIRLIEGSSIEPSIVSEARRDLPDGVGLVVLDSDHSEAHVRAELQAYADLVSRGGYLVVEDTNVNGHPTFPEHGPGPMEAVEAFLAEDRRFEPDDGLWRQTLFSFHQRGWLRRVAD